MCAIDIIKNELKGLGYDPFIVNTPKGETIFIDYEIPIGKYTGETILIGFSLQELGYPEYPPHWIHTSPPYDDDLGGAKDPYCFKDNNGNNRECLALSRPPTDIWDNLPTKHMKNYLQHVDRFCKNLK